MDKQLTMAKEQLIELKLQGYSYKKIASRCGVSRQRVQQILSPPKEIKNYIIKKYVGKCADCGKLVGKSGHIHHRASKKEDYQDIDNLILLCCACHRKRHHLLVYCLLCGKPFLNNGSGFCSNECLVKYRSERYYTKLLCSQCHREFIVRRASGTARKLRNKSKLFFCSRHCQGIYLGHHHHPGIKPKSGKSKYDIYAQQIVERLEKGDKLWRIAKDIGYKSCNTDLLEGVVKRYLAKQNI